MKPESPDFACCHICLSMLPTQSENSGFGDGAVKLLGDAENGLINKQRVTYISLPFSVPPGSRRRAKQFPPLRGAETRQRSLLSDQLRGFHHHLKHRKEGERPCHREGKDACSTVKKKGFKDGPRYKTVFPYWGKWETIKISVTSLIEFLMQLLLPYGKNQKQSSKHRSIFKV